MVEFWDKLKDWQKGAVYGCLFTLILTTYSSFFANNSLIFNIWKFSTWMIHLLPLALLPGNFSFEYPLNITNFFLILIWYTLIGFLIGLGYTTIQNINDQSRKGTFTWMLFIGSFIIIVLLNYSLMVAFFSGAGT